MEIKEMAASNELLEHIKIFEGIRLTAYKDSAGVLTIGYGHTINVREGQTVTPKIALTLLKADVRTVEEQLNKLFQGSGIVLKQGQFDALVSFTFNLGIGKLKSSTLLYLIRAKAADAMIAEQFTHWVYAGGKKLPGLVRRREWEKAMWLRG